MVNGAPGTGSDTSAKSEFSKLTKSLHHARTISTNHYGNDNCIFTLTPLFNYAATAASLYVPTLMLSSAAFCG